MIIESLAIPYFPSTGVSDLTIMWERMWINLVGRPKFPIACSSRRTLSVSLIRFLVEYCRVINGPAHKLDACPVPLDNQSSKLGLAYTLDKLSSEWAASSEWFRTYIDFNSF